MVHTFFQPYFDLDFNDRFNRQASEDAVANYKRQTAAAAAFGTKHKPINKKVVNESESDREDDEEPEEEVGEDDEEGDEEEREEEAEEGQEDEYYDSMEYGDEFNDKEEKDYKKERSERLKAKADTIKKDQ